MAQYLRARQAGVGSDLSAGLKPELFMLEQVARYGINSQISTLAYDPVQSLLAAGTNDSQFGQGQIYVFGQSRVSVVLRSKRPSSIKTLRFCAHRLISVDAKNDVDVFDLNTKQIEHSFSPPGRIAAITSDPVLDYIFIALQSGDIIAYDMDRGHTASLRIPNLWRELNPRATMTPVVSISLHPRDIGTLLIGYADGAAIYSFKQNKATSFLVYELNPGTLGGYSDPSMANRMRRPKLVDAVWHPTGTFVLTAHEDGSIVFWDPKTGKVVQARTIETPNVNQPAGNAGRGTGSFVPRNPFTKIAWCAKQNPDDTGLLIVGGTPASTAERGPTFMDLGQTPVYATSSWQVLTEHFQRAKKISTLPIPPNTDMLEFCLIPRASPHFAGAQEPIALIGVLNSGEITAMSFPSGFPISPTNQIHPSLSFICPFITRASLDPVRRTSWLGMQEKRNRGPPLVTGGAGGKKPSMSFEDRMIIQAAHADGIVRLWDIGHADDIENDTMIQVDIAKAVDRSQDVQVGCVSLSGNTGELAVGLGTGELVMFRWGPNSAKGGANVPTENFGLFDITSRAEPDLRTGFLPLRMFSGRAPVSAVKQSEIGFVAAGFQDGTIIVIDLRGPALIFKANLDTFTGPTKKGSSGRGTSGRTNQMRQESATTIEFGILSLEDENYSSILCFVGTDCGRLITLKLLPGRTGAYTVQFAGVVPLEDRVIMIAPLDPDTGKSTVATQEAMAGLRNGSRTNGILLAVTIGGIRLFKAPTARGASKTFNDVFCDAARVVTNIDGAIGLVGLFGDGTAKTYSIPGLKEIASSQLDRLTDVRRFVDALIAPTGEIVAWTGPSEMIILDAWGSGRDETISNDILINPGLPIPPRPTISNMQWISGTQHFTASDLDLLVGGPNRPPSKRMMDQQRSDARAAAAEQISQPSSSAVGSQDSYWNSMTKQITDRTNNINLLGNSMDKLEETSAGWADSVNKMVADQKKAMAMGFFKGKLGI